MKRNLIFATLAAVSLVVPMTADAGIIIIHGREANSYFSNDGSGQVARVGPTSNRSNSSNTATTTSGLTNVAASTASVDGTPVSGNQQGTEEAETDELSAYELEQIRQGLISEEEASSGCGGASAAAGPAGLLPLAVAGLALLRRRR